MHPNNSVKGVGWVVFDTQAHHAYIFGVATIAHVIKVSISTVFTDLDSNHLIANNDEVC